AWTSRPGWKRNSTHSASAVTSAPMPRVRNTTGPSPTLNRVKSSPQAPQRSAKPARLRNSVGAPQQGQAPLVPERIGGGGTGPPPPEMSFALSVTSAVDRRAPAAPDIDGGEEEQPHHVDEVPVPGRGLETEMLLRREVALVRADQVHEQEDRADD